jgi:hypothetical protein
VKSTRERLLVWAAVGVMVVLVGVAVVMVGVPAIRAMRAGGERPVAPAPVEPPGPTPPRRIEPVDPLAASKGGAEAAAPSAEAPAPVAEAAGSTGPEAVAAAGTAPAEETPVEEAPPAPVAPPSTEDDLLAPLEATPAPVAPAQPVAPKPPVRKPSVKTAKKVERVKPVRKQLTALQQEWRETRKDYNALTRINSCDNSSMSILCDKFIDLEGDVERAGDEDDAALLIRVKKMHEIVASRLKLAKLAQ